MIAVDTIVAFGDSITDTRNVFNFFDSLGIPFPFQPVAPGFYDDGRFSNGPMWIEYFAEGLGLEAPTPVTELATISPVIPFYNGNTVGTSVNFAFGGASLTTGNGPGDGEDGPFPTVEEAVGFFLADRQLAGEPIDDDTLITFLNPGASDYRGDGDLLALVPEVVGTFVDIVEDLYANGARKFLISNLPGLNRLPESLGLPPEAAGFLAAVTALHNTTLERSLAILQNELGDATFVTVDVFEAVEDIVADPQAFQFSEAVQPFFPDFVGLGNPAEFLWWDSANHLTTTGHASVADLALEALDSVLDGTSAKDTLIGTHRDELLLGRAGNDALAGRRGDDRLFGGNGKDTLKGGRGDDVLFGGDGKDKLKGDRGDDQLNGGDGKDELKGGRGDDALFGDGDRDELKGGRGRDTLIGGADSDELTGNKGDDILTGVDASSALAGFHEIDELRGGKGGDRFILGDAEQAYYSSDGLRGFAIVEDFRPQDDTIQLHGSASDYALGGGRFGTAIFFTAGTMGLELVAVLEGINIARVDLSSTVFAYV